MIQIQGKNISKTQPALTVIDIHLLLALGASLKDVQKGDYIFKEGEHCRFYHQLVRGSVRWVNIDSKGKEFIQMFVEPGECFGELPLFDDRPYAASAIASTHSLIIRLQKETFLQLIREDHAIHMLIDRMIVERLRFKFLLLKTLVGHSPKARIYELFEFLKKEKKHICQESNLIKLTRQQIASISGLRVETVIRVIRQMHEEGQLLVENRKIYYG